jgi:hypothetical protein
MLQAILHRSTVSRFRTLMEMPAIVGDAGPRAATLVLKMVKQSRFYGYLDL